MITRRRALNTYVHFLFTVTCGDCTNTQNKLAHDLRMQSHEKGHGEGNAEGIIIHVGCGITRMRWRMKHG